MLADVYLQKVESEAVRKGGPPTVGALHWSLNIQIEDSGRDLIAIPSAGALHLKRNLAENRSTSEGERLSQLEAPVARLERNCRQWNGK